MADRRIKATPKAQAFHPSGATSLHIAGIGAFLPGPVERMHDVFVSKRAAAAVNVMQQTQASF